MEKDKYKDLPLIDICDDSFFYLNRDMSKERIIDLINKYIIFELKTEDGITVIPGKLLNYKDNILFIRQYDDGTENTKSLWAIGENIDLFKDWEEKIPVDRIRGIEEYKKANEDLVFKEEYKNHICKITNKDNDGYEIVFSFRFENHNKKIVEKGYYPFYLLKDIVLIKK